MYYALMWAQALHALESDDFVLRLICRLKSYTAEKPE